MATNKPDFPDGCFVKGTAIGEFTLRSFKSAKGRDINLVEGMILANGKVVKITQSLESGQPPVLYRNGEQVVAPIVPHYSDDGLIKVNVELTRPEIAA